MIYIENVLNRGIAEVAGAWMRLAGQIDEGEVQVVNIRETDERLGPLVYTLIGLGFATLFATAVFWWLTRPRRQQYDPETP